MQENRIENIWIVNHSAIPPELGGLNRHYYFSKYLTDLGYNVRLIASSAIHNTDVNIITRREKVLFRDKKFGDVVYTFLKTSDYHGNGFSRIINLLQFPVRLLLHYKKLTRPDIIYTSSPSPFAAFAAIRLAKKMRVPLILEVRDLWPETLVVYGRYSRRNPVIWAMYRLEKWMYKKADRLIFTFEGGAEYIKKQHWDKAIDLTKIYNVNNGVDLKEYHQNLQSQMTEAKTFNNGGFKVVYTGSVRKAYSLGNLLDTAKILLGSHPDIRFLIWGDGNEKQALEERCRREGIGNVSFMGRVERSKIPAVLAQGDANLLHVNPLGDQGLAQYGCSPNKLFDYFASGKPTISNFKPNYDLIERHGCGVVAQESTPQGLAEAVIKVYNMPKDEYDRLCANAVSLARQYDYPMLTSKIDAIIRGMIT